jgi:hypothetical protein
MQTGDFRKRTEETSEVFYDITTDVPIFKIFFTLNKGLAEVFMFYNRLANRLLEPMSKFFEPLELNRRIFYRYNSFPRKERKKRMLNYHKKFITMYFLYKLSMDLPIFFSCLFTLNLFLFQNFVISLIISNIICFNFYSLKFIVKYYNIKLKKTLIGLYLGCYKNYNIDNFFYIINGIPLFHEDQYTSRMDLQNEVFAMLDFLRNEIHKIFVILIDKNKIANENSLSESEKKKLAYEYKILVEKKIMFLVLYVFNWNIFATAQLGVNKTDIRNKYSNNKYIDKKFIENIFNLFAYEDHKKKELESETKPENKSFANYVFQPFYFQEFKHFLDFFNRMDDTEFTHIEVLKSERKANIIYKIIFFFLNRKKFKLIQYSSNIKNKMFNLVSILNKNEVFAFNFFGFTISINLFTTTYTKEFFSEDLNYISFLNSFFNIRPITNKHNIPIDKYNILLTNEKNIYELEKYMNKFDAFAERLLTMHLFRFSKDNKEKVIQENIQFFVLEKQFRHFLKAFNGDDSILDKSKYYNDNINDVLLSLMKHTENSVLKEKKKFRGRAYNMDKKIMDYNSYLVTRAKLKKHALLFYHFKNACKNFDENIKIEEKLDSNSKNVENIDLKEHIKNTYNIDLK